MAPSVTSGPAERDREERRGSFPHPLQVAAAHPSEGRDINCSHQSVTPGAGKGWKKLMGSWEMGKEEFGEKEEFREKEGFREWGVLCPQPWGEVEVGDCPPGFQGSAFPENGSGNVGCSYSHGNFHTVLEKGLDRTLRAHPVGIHGAESHTVELPFQQGGMWTMGYLRTPKKVNSQENPVSWERFWRTRQCFHWEDHGLFAS